MSASREKYRNPPPPVVYVQKEEPRLVLKKAAYEDSPIYNLMKKLLDAKLYDIPNFSQYEDFVINPSSDDEIEEVPFVPVPKVVDTVDIAEEEEKPTIDPPISIKKEKESAEDSGQITTESETQKPKKKHKKRRRHSERHSRKKEKPKRSMSYNSDDSYDSKKRHRKRSSRSGSRSHSERHSKKKEKQKRSGSYNSDDSYDSKKRHRKRTSTSRSTSRSRSRSKNRNKRNYSSSSEEDIFYKKEESRSSRRTRATDDDNDDSIYYQDRQRLKRSPSTGYHQTATKVKEEDKKVEPNLLHGDYRCQVCNITTNNQLTYESHVKGKRHRKAVENQQKEAHREATMAKIPFQNQVALNEPTEKKIPVQSQALNEPIATKIPVQSQPLGSKYPEPAVGYHRKKLDTPSVIQNFLDKNSKFPCPGLHKVTEIRSPSETVYYCAICDCNCSYNSITQHLGGFKHQLNSLKYYRSDLFDKWSYKPKYQIHDKLLEVLYTEEKKYGKGVVQVEKDFKDTDSARVESQMTHLNIRDQPSTSHQSQGRQLADVEFYENYMYNSLPDPTKSGYYCKLCDSHSNSESMWSAHITGKRHLANVKKNPGLAPSKSKYIRAERNVKPILFKIIEEENEYNAPVVGLNQIREIRKPDINGILFNCFLCGACISTMDILTHILSAKHREKYLISIKHPEMETLKLLQVSESYRSSILEEICGKVQEREGMGTPDVFYAKMCYNKMVREKDPPLFLKVVQAECQNIIIVIVINDPELVEFL